ncbi:MAG: histidine kinase [Pseudomonadota bacterium]
MYDLPSRRRLLWVGFAGFVVLLLAERALFIQEYKVAVAWLGTGWLAACLVVHRPRDWLAALGPATIAGVLVYKAVFGFVLADALWAMAATLFSALFIGGSIEVFLKPQVRGALAQRIFPIMSVMTVLVMVGYAIGSSLMLRYQGDGLSFPIANALAIGVGVTATAGLGMLLGMPVRRGITRSVPRAFAVLICLAALLLLSLLGVAKYPSTWFEAMQPYQYTSHTLAAVAGVSLTVFVGPIFVATAVLALVISVGIALKTQALQLPQADGVVMLVEGQSLLLGIAAIMLLCTAMMNSQRRIRRLAAANQEIAQWIQRAHANIPRHVMHARITQLEKALEIAGEYCDASLCAIYLAEQMSREEFTLNVEQIWSRENSNISQNTLSPTVDSRRHPALRNMMTKSRSFYFPATSDERPPWARAFVADTTLQASIMPMSFDEEIAGALVMVSKPQARIRDSDVESLLGTIRDHYLGYQNHAVAVRSMFVYQRQLRELAARLSDAAERVRRQTSVELHDGLVQRLAVARMKLGEVSRRRVSAPETIEAITNIVDDALAATRGIIRELSTSVLYELGLIPALQELTQNLDQVGDIAISLEEQGERVTLSEPLRVMIFTTIRELVENARLHADCHNLWIKVRWDHVRGIAAIEVSDDGVQQGWWLGKDLSTDLGLGLAGISEQLRRFGYELKFDFRPGGGTRAMII